MKSLVTGILLVILTACSADLSIRLDPNDLSGETQVRLQISPVLHRYYQDITGNYESESPFDVNVIQFELAKRKGMNLRSRPEITSGSLALDIDFENINAILKQELTEENDITLIDKRIRRDGKTELSFNIGRELIASLLSIGLVQNNEVSSYLLPAEGSDPQTYKEDLIWALEEYENSTALSRLIDRSEISFELELPTKPVEVSPNVSIQSSGARSTVLSFSFPVLNILTQSTQKEIIIVY